MDVVKSFKLSGASYQKMVHNLLWALGYTVVALPLAAGALNARLLRRLDPSKA
jgi:Cu2+-exporting ATPase